ncbi:MAG: type II toxin-antitoxin system RelE family toxin [Candidatus Nanopelagicales bacterium]
MAPRYSVQLVPSAARQLKKLDPAAKARIQGVIELLQDDPRPPGAKKLVGGNGELRVRSGNYRVVYDIDDGVVLILVLAIGHRKDVYRRG